jgi:DNA mismatch repair protein MutS
MKLPPMLTQYLAYKSSHPDCLLFFQVGDFYELFFQDAVTVSRTLNLTLTTRDKNNPDPVPMCGVPIGVIDGYIDRLVSAGFSAALVRQVGAPTGKGMVTRELERIVTPGIRLLSNSAESDAGGTIVAAVFPDRESEFAVAYAEVQTGVVHVCEGLPPERLSGELSRLAPAEIVVPSIVEGRKIDRRLGWVREVDAVGGSRALKFRTDSRSREIRACSEIPGYATIAPVTQRAVRLLIEYIDEVTVGARLVVRHIAVARDSETVAIDATTRRNLELVRATRDNGVEGSLFHFMNTTVTPGGAKVLRHRIVNPAATLERVTACHAAVGGFVTCSAGRAELRRMFEFLPDLERIAARLELGVVTPRELGALRNALLKVPQVREVLGREFGADLVGLIAELARGLTTPTEWTDLLVRALADDPPLVAADGGILREGYDPELDRLRTVKSRSTAFIAELEAREKTRTGIGSLKVRYNNVIGFFIEVTKANVERVPGDFIRRQQTANGERFTTAELRALEVEVLGADAKVAALEGRLFADLRTELRGAVPEVRRLAEVVAELDVHAALAELAEREDLVRPVMSTDTDMFIEEGRHPVIARLLEGRFVPNSLELRTSGKRCALITGPNMGGKSTFLRQAALIAIMAQAGSYVPARSARLGLVDRVFARIGASDNLAEGESTFMVEMREVSHIVAQATERSLVLVDEVGRGTATTDGLALAQAILEWIVTQVNCRTLFATHFHELTALEPVYPALDNLSVGSIDDGGDVVFTHAICRGAASKSYGLEVAKLAGLPQPLLERARTLLVSSSASAGGRPAPPPPPQLPLFSPAPVAGPRIPDDYTALKALERRLQGIDPNRLTPLEALIVLNELVTELAVVGRPEGAGVWRPEGAGERRPEGAAERRREGVGDI